MAAKDLERRLEALESAIDTDGENLRIRADVDREFLAFLRDPQTPQVAHRGNPVADLRRQVLFGRLLADISPHAGLVPVP